MSHPELVNYSNVSYQRTKQINILQVPNVSIQVLSGSLGAVVTGLDLSQPLAPEVVFELKELFRQHLVVIFKQQQLDDEQYLDFVQYFGSVYHSPKHIPVLASAEDGENQTIVLVANTNEGYTGSGELTAHSDHHWTPVPSKASFLYALAVPKQGGDTLWANHYQIYEDLPAATKERIRYLQLITYNPFVRRLKGGEPRLYRDLSREPISTGFPHPLVATHPETGRKVLFLDQATEVEVLGLTQSEGEALIAELRAHAAQAKYLYRHHWEVGDLVYWDNLATTHQRPAFDPQHTRILKRISLAGTRPV